jgi:hypothetical protein
MNIRRPFEKFVDSTYYSDSELCVGAVTVYFSKYLPWQPMHFLQRSTHCCRPFAAGFRRVVEKAVFLPRSSLFMVVNPRNRMGQDLDSMGLMDEL